MTNSIRTTIDDYSNFMKSVQLSPIKEMSANRRSQSVTTDDERKAQPLSYFRTIADPIPELSVPMCDPREAIRLRAAELSGNDGIAIAEAEAKQENAMHNSTFNYTHTHDRVKGFTGEELGDHHLTRQHKMIVLRLPMDAFQTGGRSFAEFNWNESADGAPLVHSMLVLFAELHKQLCSQHDNAIEKITKSKKKKETAAARRREQEGFYLEEAEDEDEEKDKEDEEEDKKEILYYDKPIVLCEVVADHKTFVSIPEGEMDPLFITKVVNANPAVVSELRIIIAYREAMNMDIYENLLSYQKTNGSCVRVSCLCSRVCA